MTTEQYEELFPETIRTSLKDCIRKFDVEQKPLREYHLKEYKKLDFYWNNLQNIFWSETSRDWRPYSETITANPSLELDEDDIGRVVNIYRAYGESIIAGLAAAVPGIQFAPDDADSIDDVSTSKAFSKIAELINLHNDAPVKLVQALFILFNQAFVAAYNHFETSEEYGFIKVPTDIPGTQIIVNHHCSYCGTPLDVDESLEPEYVICPVCNQYVMPESTPEIIQVLIPSVEDVPKSREIVDLYGPLNVKIPFYASSQKMVPYLILEAEYHISDAKALFPWVADKIKGSKSYSDYEKWARQPSEAYMNPDSEIVTIRKAWLRPSAYYMMTDAQREEMTERFPNGCYSVFVDDVFIEASDESLDEHWTITKNPLSNYLHAPPIGRPLIDIQDMTNDMYNLTLRTIQYGIPMTFAESDALDWDKFKETPAEPGLVYPGKSKPGQGISASFHTVKTATLSQEVDNFNRQLESAGQFVSGAFPSIYGGTMQGGGKTFKEYDASRAQALQRLGVTWKMINVWWKDFIFKACKEYARNLQYDEKYAKKTGNSYVNVWIKRSELSGHIGSVEAETSDQFPTTLVQKRGLLLELLGLQNDQINAAIFHPENLDKITRILGFNEIYVPGEDQRNKQLYEISELAKSEPLPNVDQQGQPIETSSIPPEEIDDDAAHIATIDSYLLSDVGQALKVENEMGYQNIMLHRQEHQQAQQQKMLQEMQQQAQIQEIRMQLMPVQDQPPQDKGTAQ